MSTNHETMGPVIALKLPRGNGALITFAKAVHDHMSNNPSFPSPSPTLDVLAADITAFEEAETKVAGRSRGAAKLRDARARKVKGDLAHLRDYVQGVAEARATPADAAAVIESAFMSVKKMPTRRHLALEAKNADLSGSVTLIAKAVARTATYFWQYSLDQETWTSAPETMKSRAVISGLASARIHYFRFRALTRTGEIGYSQVVSLLVH
ncbi:Hypothetical protein A7982_04311 [Minicystis rosea]|nr:Hypothetical protein A7982_04311 [Minicystis rosea]